MKILNKMLTLGIVFVTSVIGLNFSVYGTVREPNLLQKQEERVAAETAVQEAVELSEAEGIVFFDKDGINIALFGSLKSRPYLNKNQVVMAILQKNAIFKNALFDYIISQKMSPSDAAMYRQKIEKQVKKYFSIQ